MAVACWICILGVLIYSYLFFATIVFPQRSEEVGLSWWWYLLPIGWIRNSFNERPWSTIGHQYETRYNNVTIKDGKRHWGNFASCSYDGIQKHRFGSKTGCSKWMAPGGACYWSSVVLSFLYNIPFVHICSFGIILLIVVLIISISDVNAHFQCMMEYWSKCYFDS